MAVCWSLGVLLQPDAAAQPQFRRSEPMLSADPVQSPEFRSASLPQPGDHAPAAAEPSVGFRNSGPAIDGTEGMRTLPRDAYQTPPVGVPYRVLFRDSGPPYTDSLRDVDVRPTANVSDNLDFHGRLDLPDFRGRFPLLERGFDPEDADLKIGPVYIDFRAISAAVLASDNVNRDNDNRESGTIAIIRLSAAIQIQLTEGLQLSASGSYAFLPFTGASGGSLYAPYTFGLEGISVARSEVSWSTIIGGWNVVLADNFRVGTGYFTNNTRDSFEFFGDENDSLEDSDRAGRYSYRLPRSRDGNSRDNRRDDDFYYYSNEISATMDRLLPGEVRLRVRGYHTDLWYNRGRRGLPNLREGASVLLASERENQRFKPYLSYHAFRSDTDDGFDQTVRFGLAGPITDQLDFHGSIGYNFRSESDSQSFLWRLSLRHVAGPYTTESLTYSRTLSDFHDEILEYVTYRIHQRLGSKLRADAFASYGSTTSLGDGAENDSDDGNQLRFGLRFTHELGPRTQLVASGTYSRTDWVTDAASETWTGRMELSYHFTDDFFARLIYQYQQRHSEQESDRYTENLVFLSLTKHFR